MSIEVIKLVLNAEFPEPPAGTPAGATSASTRKLVLFGMANHAHPDGTHCYPSVPRLEIYTGLHGRTILRVQAELEALGLIRRVGSGRRGSEAGWELDLRKLSAMHHPRIDPVTGRLLPEQGDSPPPYPGPKGDGATSFPGRQGDSGGGKGDSGDRKGDSGDRVSVLSESKPLTDSKTSRDQTPLVQVLAGIRRRVSKADFETWFRDIVLVSRTPSPVPGGPAKVVLGAANKYARDYLEEHAELLAAMFSETLTGSGRVELEFVVREPAPEP